MIEFLLGNVQAMNFVHLRLSIGSVVLGIVSKSK